MKIKTNIQDFTQERLEYYTKLANIPWMPTLITRTREVYDIPKNLTRGRRTSAYKYHGVCYNKAKTIFVNIRLHHSRKSIEHTVAHEIIHMRYPYMSHGSNFDKRIKVIQSGKASKPPKHKYLEKWK